MSALILPEGWAITARMPAQDQDGYEAFFAFDEEHNHQYGRIYYFRPGAGPDVPVFPQDFIPKEQNMHGDAPLPRRPGTRRRTAIESGLGWLIDEVQKDLDDVNARTFPINDCKAVANTLTKLKEARMWHREAGPYYKTR